MVDFTLPYNFSALETLLIVWLTQKRRRKTFGNSDEVTQSTSQTLTDVSAAEADEDVDDSDSADDLNDDPDWVSGLTPGGPQRTLPVKVSILIMIAIINQSIKLDFYSG